GRSRTAARADPALLAPHHAVRHGGGPPGGADRGAGRGVDGGCRRVRPVLPVLAGPSRRRAPPHPRAHRPGRAHGTGPAVRGGGGAVHGGDGGGRGGAGAVAVADRTRAGTGRAGAGRAGTGRAGASRPPGREALAPQVSGGASWATVTTIFPRVRPSWFSRCASAARSSGNVSETC